MDDYQQIVRVGRGWRLADPLEGIRMRFGRRRAETECRGEFDLSDKEINSIMELVHKRATTQAGNTFAVHPPKKLVDDPSIASSDSVIEELKDSVFLVVFQDGTSRMLSLPELMCFVYNLIVLADQHRQVAEMVRGLDSRHDMKVEVSVEFAMQEIMRTETVKAVLNKIGFSEIPCDC